ncbi:MAG: class C sortase [Agathobacter sp.]|nr:class C sortase [Agathobacter sp.]
MKKSLSTIILTIILIIGVSLLLYPTISDYWNEFHQSKAIASYVEVVETMDQEKIQNILDSAIAYNERLRSKNNRWSLSEEDIQEYNNTLNVSGTGIMGYIDIPSISVQLPVYHSTDEEILQVGIGHIEGSSLPVGGENTHTVVSGHRGLRSAKLFTDIDQLSEGDIFKFYVLGDTLTYQIDQIRIVLPGELNDLKIEPGKDLATLVTCTPYGVNSHRLLVRGHRIENSDADKTVVTEATQIKPLYVAVILSVLILVLYVIVVTLIDRIILFRFR